MWHIFYAVTIMNQNIRPRKSKRHSLFCFSSFLVPPPPSLFVYHRIIIICLHFVLYATTPSWSSGVQFIVIHLPCFSLIVVPFEINIYLCIYLSI